MSEPSASASPSEYFVLSQSPQFGQHLAAAKDIPAGTLIVEEKPAFYGPSADYTEDYSTPLCLGCCVVMNSGNEGNRCPSCKWPICGPQCDKASYHREFECELLAKEKVVFPPEKLPIQNAYKGLTILRGLLLREKDPRMWEKVMNLQHENEVKEEGGGEGEDFNEFKTLFGLPNFGSNEDWKRILGVLNVNSYSIQRIEKIIGSPSFAEFIYPYQCLMNHSCISNCNWAITYSPEFVIRVKASVDIKKGEMLTVAYNYDLTKYGANKRQQRIREQAKFSCKCPRCLDPTDFGSFSGGVVCFKCKSGIMLPLDSIKADSDWNCSQCPYKMCQSFMSSFVESLQERIEMEVKEAEEMEESVVEILEDFISDNSGTVLHPNHWVLAFAVQSIINHQCLRLHELSLEELDSFVSHCEYILGIREMTTQGISTEKGILRHHIARARFRKLELMEVAVEQREESELEEEIKTVHGLQKDAILFWEENPHYGTLHLGYKKDAQLLRDEMSQLRNKYSFLQ